MSTRAVPSPPVLRSLALDPRQLLRRAYATNAPLTLAGMAMVAASIISIAGLVVDRQIITGAPAWLKPAKFALSLGVYSFTLVHLLSFVRGHWRLVAVATTLIAAGIAVEMSLIALQVARGTTSHFNFTTALNAAIFDTMGGFIATVWMMSLLVAILLLRQPLPNPAWLDVRRRLALVWTAALGYLGLILLLEWQALRGQFIVKPDATTLVTFALLVAAVAVSGGAIVVHARRVRVLLPHVAEAPR